MKIVTIDEGFPLALAYSQSTAAHQWRATLTKYGVRFSLEHSDGPKAAIMCGNVLIGYVVRYHASPLKGFTYNFAAHVTKLAWPIFPEIEKENLLNFKMSGWTAALETAVSELRNAREYVQLAENIMGV